MEMYQFESTRGRDSRLIDILHVIICIIVVVMAALAFTNPNENKVLFPLIFLMAALLNLITGIYEIRKSEHDKKRLKKGGIQTGFGLIVGVLGIISAINIWL